MIQENEIDWNVFTQEERIRLQGLLDERRFGDLAAVVALDLPKEASSLVYAKVAELEKMKKIYQPSNTEKISHVREEYEAWLTKNPKGIETKDQEKYWDDRFKDEQNGWKNPSVESSAITSLSAESEVKPKRRGRPKKVADAIAPVEVSSEIK